MNTNVLKSGGSSLKDSVTIFETIHNVFSSGDCYHWVVSAPGESDLPGEEHERVTPALRLAADLMEKGQPWEEQIDKVLKIFSIMAGKLGVSLDTIDYFSTSVINEIKSKGMYRDFFLHLGERLQGRLLTAVLRKQGYPAKFVDPMECIFFYKNGEVNRKESYLHIRTHCRGNYMFVIPGFYGRGNDGRVKTFPPNGSDVTFTTICGALEPRFCDKGTDVPGIFSVRPILPNEEPVMIDEMTLRDLRKFLYSGLSLIQKDSLIPLTEKQLTMRVRNPNIPENIGTLIVPDLPPRAPKILGIAGKKDFLILSIEKSMMNEEIGSALKMLSVLKDLKISFEHAPTGIDVMCFAINRDYIEENFPVNTELVSKVKQAIEADVVKVIDEIAILSVIWTEYKMYFDHQITGALLSAGVEALELDGGKFTGQKLIYLNNADFERAEVALAKEFFGSKENFNEEVLSEPCAC